MRTILLSLALAASGPLLAHHAVNVAYDTQNLSTVEGTVVDVFWRNPHVVVSIERTLENGEQEIWEAESGSTNALERLGIGREIVEIGDRVALMGAPSRRGLTTMAAYTMTLADGTEVPLWPQRAARIGRDVTPAPISEAAREQSSQEAEGIFRIWSRTSVTGLQSTLPFTEAAVTAREDFDPLADDPALRCIPPGMPGMMNNPYPIEFVDQGERILLRLEEWDGERIIHLSPDFSAAGQPSSHVGVSTGHWEGTTLVVTTTKINESFFDDVGTPQSEDVEVVERFEINETGDRIDYVAVVADPGTFSEPATLTGAWHWIPGEEIKPFQCALPENSGD